MGCASFFISTTLSIKKPHYTLNDTNIGPLHCLCKCIFYALNSHNPCIKIIGGSAAYHPVKGWVNIIRTCLKAPMSHYLISIPHCLTVANNHNGEHINLFVCKIMEVSNDNRLPFSEAVGNNGYWCIFRSMPFNDLLCLYYLLHPLSAFRVIEDDDKITLSSTSDSPLYHLPWCEKVTQA